MNGEKLFSDKFQCNDQRPATDETRLCRHHFAQLTDEEAKHIATFLLETFYAAGTLPVSDAVERNDDPQSGTTLTYRFTSDAEPALQKLLAELDSAYGYDAANAVPVKDVLVKDVPTARTTPLPAPRTR